MGIELSKLNVSPFDTLDWNGEVYSFFQGYRVRVSTGDAVYLLTPDNVEDVIAYIEDGDEWDGIVVGIVKMKDGRFVSWETFYGPTGTGFTADAYGGDADVVVTSSIEEAYNWMTDEGRRILGVAER